MLPGLFWINSLMKMPPENKITLAIDKKKYEKTYKSITEGIFYLFSCRKGANNIIAVKKLLE